MTEKAPLPGSEIMRGTAHRVIVVKSPDERIFKEAVFILKDDYFVSQRSERELMREALRCAGDFTAAAVPNRRKVPLWPIIPLLFAVIIAAIVIFL